LRKLYPILNLIVALCAFQARADVTVVISFGGFSIDPVYFVTGEIVEWDDDDGNGPFSVGVYNSSGSISGLTPFAEMGKAGRNFCHGGILRTRIVS
jgi:hypothetical protein